MVYCGKPSKGCSNCRERKIRVSLLFSFGTLLRHNWSPQLGGMNLLIGDARVELPTNKTQV
jgi:hypothetical protein